MPLYHQVSNLLLEEIGEGKYEVGSYIPSERELIEYFQVSRITIRRALDALVAQGVLMRAQGKGTVVIKSPAQRTITPLMGSLESIVEMGETTNARVIAATFEKAGKLIAKSLKIRPDEPVLKVTRIRNGSDGPFAYLNNWVKGSISGLLNQDELEEKSILSQLKAQGMMPQTAEQVIRATLCPPDVAQVLETSVGVPLLEVHRVYFFNGEPIIVLRSLYRSDRYAYKVHLSSENAKIDGIVAEAGPWDSVDM